MSALRTFANRAGITYDAAKTSVIFAEDMNLIKTLLELMGVDYITNDSGNIIIGGTYANATGKLRVNGTISSNGGFQIPGLVELVLQSFYVAGAFRFRGYDGTDRADLIKYINTGTSSLGLAFARRCGFGTETPTAKVHLGEGSATANTAPLKFTAGTNMTTPENGAMEFDGSKLYLTVGGVRKEIAFV